LEKTLISLKKLGKKIKIYFKNLENFKIDHLMREVFFFQKTNFSMEICQRQEDPGSWIIRNMSLNGLANAFVFHSIEFGQIIWKK
jgi:hypothetical protein